MLRLSQQRWGSLTATQKQAAAELARRHTAQDRYDPSAESPLKWLELTKPKIFHPTDGWVTFEPRWYQSDILGAWDHPLRIILKSRQIGISQVCAAEAAWKMLYQGPRRILNVSRNVEQATDFIAYVRAFIPSGELVEDNKTRLTLRNGSSIRAQGDSPSAGRGTPASDVYLDEFAFPRWANEIWQAIQPTVSTGGSLTVLSTPYGASGKFHDLWGEAIGEGSGWASYNLPWTVLFDEAWAAKTRKRLSRSEFASEHDCSFEESGDRMWRHSDIDRCMLPEVSEGPRESHKYLITADMAGMGVDSTVILVVDITAKPYRIVHVRKLDRASNDTKIQAFHDLSALYGAKDLHLDATGQSALDLIEEVNKGLKSKDPDIKRTAHSFIFSAKTKPEALQRLTRLLEHGEVQYDDPHIREELLAYKLPDTGLKTDHVMALAIAAHILERPTAPARATVIRMGG
ncbi:MAG TPA: terminase family protein [Armatimonadota bacterium]